MTEITSTQRRNAANLCQAYIDLHTEMKQAKLVDDEFRSALRIAVSIRRGCAHEVTATEHRMIAQQVIRVCDWIESSKN